MTGTDIRNIVKKDIIDSEADYERALMADRSLRILARDDSSFVELRNQLRILIEKYENLKWTDLNTISDQRLRESTAAEQLVLAEQQFLKRRKEIIIARLADLGLIQKDLGTLLNHGKSYTSELLNGIRAFSSADLILIHRLLRIDLNDLFPTHVPIQVEKRVRASISKISSKSIRIKPMELELVNL